MRFGRVEGVVVPETRDGEQLLALTVYLETGDRLEIVRAERLRPLRPLLTTADLVWHADQWTQETIGVELAREGWEVIGAGEVPEPEPGELVRSATYAVRRLG
jgi:hypothetical protein